MGFGDHGLASRSPLEIFRDHDAEAPLDLRFLKYGGMPEDKDEYGRYAMKQIGDRAGAVYWEPEDQSKRAIAGQLGQWWFGALSIDKPDGLRVLLNDTDEDTALKAKRDITLDPVQRVTPSNSEYRNTYGHTLPLGTIGTLMQGGSQDEWRQFFLPSLELVAHHNGMVPERIKSSAPECSTRVYDVAVDGYVDWKRGAGLHSHLWDAQLPVGGPLGMDGSWVPAWNLARSAGDPTGYGAWVTQGPVRGGGGAKAFIEDAAGGSLGAFASTLASGPLHSGEPDGKDKHFIGRSSETAWNAGHIGTDAYFFMDRRRDAPLAFERLEWPDPADFPIKTKVHLVYRDKPTHPFVGGPRQGLWDWYSSTVIRGPYIDQPPPKVPPPSDPPTYKLPPIGGGGGGGGGGVVTGGGSGDPDNHPGISGGATQQIETGKKSQDAESKPEYQAGESFDTKKTRIDPARTPYELALPSLYFFPVRDPSSHPYDGRFGGKPVDGGPSGDGPWSPDGLRAIGKSSPIQPGDPEFGQIPVSPLGGGGFPQDPEYGQIPIPPLGGSGSPGITQAAQAASDAGFDLDNDPKNPSGPVGFGGRASARKRHEAEQARAWSDKPLAFHIQGFAKSSGSGWATNTSSGTEYLSGTVDGGIVLGPAEPLLDGTAPDSVSLATVVLASENILGTRYSGKATRLAFGTHSYSTGTVTDGWYFAAPGASGSVELELRALDASSVARVGNFSLYARLLADDGTAANPSLSFYNDTDTGIYRGGTNQINFATGGTLRARINTAALAPAGSGTTLGALSDPWAAAYVTALTVTTITAPTVPVWTKYTVGYAALAAAATTNNIELLSLPAGGIIHAVKIKHSTAFSGGGAASYTVSVGITGTLNKYAAAFDVFAAVGATVQQLSTTVGTENHGSATSIKIAATCDVNLDLVTAGSVDVWVLASKAV